MSSSLMYYTNTKYFQTCIMYVYYSGMSRLLWIDTYKNMSVKFKKSLSKILLWRCDMNRSYKEQFKYIYLDVERI